MSKRESAKYKIDRRLGENIWGRPKSPVNRREYGPGQHGQRRKGKLSDFGLQLRAKQKLKGYYGDISEKQFRKVYEEANRRKGDTPENLIGLLESRLDAVVYRAKFVPTIFAARQFVNHGHVNVNGRRVNIPSYRCKPGDVIEVREKSKQLVIVLESVQLAERDVPDYIEVDDPEALAGLAKIDLRTGEVLKFGVGSAPSTGAVLTTAGNLVFHGNMDRRFRAFHAETGEQLWETILPGNASVSTISYAVDGRQYVAVMTGENLKVPELLGLAPRMSTTRDHNAIQVFALPRRGRAD